MWLAKIFTHLNFELILCVNKFFGLEYTGASILRKKVPFP